VHELRRPGLVPAGPGDADLLDVSAGIDTDADGRPDTLVTDDGVDLVLATDLDGDGIADQVLRVGPNGVVREAVPQFPAAADPGDALVDGSLGGAELGSGPH
jgi:hypothetical protein